MAEKCVSATKVRLIQPAPCNGYSGLGTEWTSENVKNLVVFPEHCMARCEVNARTLIARYAWAEVDPDGLREWTEGSHPCPECAQSFASSQGLATHIAIKHTRSKKGGS